MAEDFLSLLKKICEGDVSAWQTFNTLFHQHNLTMDVQIQAFSYIKQMAKGNVYAMYAQALFYDEGIGAKQDPEMALILMREAAGLGHTAATFEVGRRFLYGIGIAQNYQHALQWLTRAAESPHYYPAAMFHIGLIYGKGWGVAMDQAKAKAWMDKATAKGYLTHE